MLSFVKYEGCGNDFILIDNRSGFLNRETLPHFPFAALCQRQKGVGADGVLLLEHSLSADFRMRIFNADGSEAEMCGNGLRCLAKHLHEQFPSKTKFTIETMHQQNAVCLVDNQVEASLSATVEIGPPINLQVDAQPFTVHFLDTGVPHAVIFCDQLTHARFESHARQIRFHPHFAPKGTNVNFVQLLPTNRLSIRTYERGVEQETLACGTGAIAAALAAAKLRLLSSPITIQTAASDLLQVSFENSSAAFSAIRLQGPATKVFEGKWTVMDNGQKDINDNKDTSGPCP